MTKNKLIKILHEKKQIGLLKRLNLSTLSKYQINSLISQITNIHFFKKPTSDSFLFLKKTNPITKCETYTNEDINNGKNLLNKTAVILLAGGEGSRLNFNKPKALFPILNKKTLLELFFEKLPKNTYCIIMVSPNNKRQIINYLKKNKFFNANPNKLFILEQTVLPAMDKTGIWHLKTQNKICLLPDGNGSLFHLLYTTPNIFHLLIKTKKIDLLSIVSIDNPILDPLNPGILSFHKRKKNEITILTTDLDKKNQRAGLLIKENNNLNILEYIFIKKNLEKGFINVGAYIISTIFLEKAHNFNFPIHFTKKKSLIFYNNKYITKKIYKPEKFIFDAFKLCNKCGCVYIKKKTMLSTFKNKTLNKKSKKSFIEA